MCARSPLFRQCVRRTLVIGEKKEGEARLEMIKRALCSTLNKFFNMSQGFKKEAHDLEEELEKIFFEIKQEPDLEEELEKLSVMDSWEEDSNASTEAGRPYSPSQPWPWGAMDVASVAEVVPSPAVSPSQTPPGSPSPPPPSQTNSSAGACANGESEDSPMFGGLRPAFWALLEKELEVENCNDLPTWRSYLQEFTSLPPVRSEEEIRASDIAAINLLCGYITAAEMEKRRRRNNFRRLDLLMRSHDEERQRRRQQQQQQMAYEPFVRTGRRSSSTASLAEWRRL